MRLRPRLPFPLRRPRFRPLEPWQRDQYVVVLTVALAHVAFDLTQPFIPLYVRELGVTDLADAAFWSGLIVGAGPLCRGLMGPFWGALADRYGRKPMVLRALVMIGIMQFAMAFVPNVHWLLALRVVMGLFAGFTPMAMALAISVSPRERMAQAIGMVQAAQFLPLAIGPTIGGVISDTFGLRTNFMLTGVMLLIPAALLYFMVKEPGYRRRRDGQAQHGGRRARLGAGAAGDPRLRRRRSAILFLARFTDRALPPILPLYLIELDTPSAQLATITGFVGRVRRRRRGLLVDAATAGGRAPSNTRRLLLIALAGGAVFSALLALASGWPEVVVLRVVLGLLAGGTMSLAYTMGARLAPPSRSGLTLSMLSSCGQLGGALAPMLAGLVGEFSLRYVFLTTAGAYPAACMLTAACRGPHAGPEPELASEPEA